MGLRPYHRVASACSILPSSRGCSEAHCGWKLWQPQQLSAAFYWCAGVGEDDDCTKAWEILLLATTHKHQPSFSLFCHFSALPITLVFAEGKNEGRWTLPLVFLTCLHKQNNFYSFTSDTTASALSSPLTSKPVWCLSVLMKRKEEGQVQPLTLWWHGKKESRLSLVVTFAFLRMISLSHRDIHMSSESLSCVRLPSPYFVPLSIFFTLSEDSLRPVYKYPWLGVHAVCTCVFVKMQGCKVLQAKQTHVELQCACCKKAQVPGS